MGFCGQTYLKWTRTIMLAVWSNEPRSFIPPVTHKPRDAVSSGDSWEESAMSGMATFPKLMSYCLKSLWGRPCWSQQPCLARFLPKARVQVTQVPETSCVIHGLGICGVVWCAWAAGQGYARTLLFHLHSLRKLVFKPYKEPQRCGDPRVVRRYLCEGRPVLILTLETKNLPCFLKFSYSSHHLRTQSKPFCASITQLGAIIGSTSPTVWSKWDWAGCI